MCLCRDHDYECSLSGYGISVNIRVYYVEELM